MPASFGTLQAIVRKVDVQQIIDALTSGSTASGVPINTAINSASTALKVKQTGAGNIVEFLKPDGTTVFSIDAAGAVSTLSFGAGTVSNPTLFLDGDSDTGWWKPDANEIAFSLGGVKHVHWQDGSLEFLDTIKATLGTVTTNLPVLTATVTWNEGSTAFDGLKLVATDNASAVGSLLLDLHAGAAPTSKFSVRKDGLVTAAGGLAVTGNSTITGNLSISGTITANRTRTFALAAVSHFTTPSPGIAASNDGTYGIPVHKLGDAGTDFIDAIGPLPDDYVAGTQLTIRARWWMESATSGNVVLTMQTRQFVVGVTPALGSLGNSANNVIAVPGSADVIAEFSFTTTTAPTSDDHWLLVRVARVGGDVNDTAIGDLNIVAVIEVEYTAES